MFKLMTERLVLRDFQASDLSDFCSLRRDDKFLRFYDEQDSTDQKAQELLTDFVRQASERPRSKYQLAIETKAGELIGTCGLRAEGGAEFSIGCELGRLWHGKGIAFEAGKAIVDFGFRQLNAKRIYAETVTENKAAVRLCRQLGMNIESEEKGDRYFKGRQWGTTILSLHRSAWGSK